jgi:hypothetical protein
MTAQDREAIVKALDESGSLVDDIEALIEHARGQAIYVTRGKMERAWAGRVYAAEARTVRAWRRIDRLNRLISALLRSRHIDRAVIRAVEDEVAWQATPHPRYGTPFNAAMSLASRRTVRAMAEADRATREEHHHE